MWYWRLLFFEDPAFHKVPLQLLIIGNRQRVSTVARRTLAQQGLNGSLFLLNFHEQQERRFRYRGNLVGNWACGVKRNDWRTHGDDEAQSHREQRFWPNRPHGRDYPCNIDSITFSTNLQHCQVQWRSNCLYFLSLRPLGQQRQVYLMLLAILLNSNLKTFIWSWANLLEKFTGHGYRKVKIQAKSKKKKKKKKKKN
jgi:hypothetical protein